MSKFSSGHKHFGTRIESITIFVHFDSDRPVIRIDRRGGRGRMSGTGSIGKFRCEWSFDLLILPRIWSRDHGRPIIERWPIFVAHLDQVENTRAIC